MFYKIIKTEPKLKQNLNGVSNLLLFMIKIQCKLLIRLRFKKIWYFFVANINGWVIKGKENNNVLLNFNGRLII